MTTIQRSTGDYYNDGQDADRWLIEDEDGIVAGLWVNLDTREVMQIEVRADRQREGLATALWNAATRISTVLHAPASHRTPEGDAFAQSVGGDSVPCTFGCCTDDEE